MSKNGVFTPPCLDRTTVAARLPLVPFNAPAPPSILRFFPTACDKFSRNQGHATFFIEQRDGSIATARFMAQAAHRVRFIIVSRARGGLVDCHHVHKLDVADRNTSSVKFITPNCGHPATLYHFVTYRILLVSVQHQLDRLTLMAPSAQKEIPFL
jgi:hypothetical protein